MRNLAASSSRIRSSNGAACPPGELILIDEVLTPDSSRFWPKDTYKPGASPPSFDKQFVRDYLETTPWDKASPPPPLPPEVVDKTAAKYRESPRTAQPARVKRNRLGLGGKDFPHPPLSRRPPPQGGG
ncbi:MAG: phosphoribosylaminoimidazolesuccinocarboxamide synthase [Gemmataceae bacterium]